MPNSFKTALEEIEDEIAQLAEDLAFQKKEMYNLKSEQDTIVDVAKAQDADIERYLNKENGVLREVIAKQHTRQAVEFKRLDGQCCDVKKIVEDLDASRMECVHKVKRVQEVLGIHVDAQEDFLQPLSA